jgi:acyl-[acyl-carrier-protein]-phospholipid O-acyltransferase/long-chain-fatty-acid--[acyl-carrier-protein] ligase
MLGYLRADNPGVIEAPPEGWYDTGDIVEIDEHRFVTILGRAKRFSKIAGEMVSLTAVETKLKEAFPGESFAVIAIPDEKKGEQLIMFTSISQPDRKEISDGLKSRGASDLMVPKVLVHLKEIPLLGSGKTDYVTLTRVANEGANG